MSEGVSINKAAMVLGKSPSTIRRWVQKGAPCVSLGSVGRNKGSLVNIEDLLQWRGGGIAKASHEDRLQFIATVLMDCLRRDKIQHRIDVTERQAAGLLALVYERFCKNLLHEPPERDKLPDEITQLLAIWVY